MPSRIRNKIIFLTCLLAFLGGGIVVYREWVVQKPFAVILFVSENFSPSQMASARLFAGGADFRFKMESLPHSALAKAKARDYAVADSAAAASSLATGQTVNRGALALTPEGQPLQTLLQAARQAGRVTGVVSNTSLTDPATAAFFAHASESKDHSSLVLQLTEETMPDILLGGGRALWIPQEQGGVRRDGRNLLLEARQRGFDIVRTKSELENTPGWRAPRVFGVFADGDLDFVEDRSKHASQPRLSDLVRRGIQLLQFSRQGYFLVVHAGLAGRAAELGRGETLLREYGELDNAIATALQYAGEDALLVVAGLANTGGLRHNAFSFAPDRGIAVLGPSASGVPALSWSTGPGQATLEVVATETIQPEPVTEDVLVLATGPGSANLRNFSDLTEVHTLLANEL